MANLDPRTDSFISLLLDVSGRARPGDMNNMPVDDAAALLQAYAAAHPEKGLAYDGQTLAYGAPVATPEPVPVAEEPAVIPAVEVAPAPVPDVSQPAPALGVPEADSELPAWMFEEAPAPEPVSQPTMEVLPSAGVEVGTSTEFDAAPPFQPAPTWEPVPTSDAQPAPAFEPAPDFTPAPAADPAPVAFEPAPDFAPAPSFDAAPVPAAAPHEAVFAQPPAVGAYPSAPGVEPRVAPAPVADYGVPQPPAQGGYYGVADAAPPEYAGSETANFAPVGDFAPQSATATMDYLMQAPAGPAPIPTRINNLWWLAVLFFGAPGAFVAWFLNRDKTGSKTFLWVAIGLTVLAVLAVAALFGLGLFASSALQTRP